MRCYNKFALVVFFASCISACEPDRAPLVAAKKEERIQHKIREFKRIHDRRCREDLEDEAVRLADSIIREQVRLSPLDSLEKPPRPTKPVYPGSQRDRDTFFIKDRPTN